MSDNFIGVELELNAYDMRINKERLQERNKRLSSMRPVMIKIGAFLRGETKRNFDSGGRYAGNAWASNAIAYKQWKYRNATDPRVMHRFLKLRRALATKYGAGHLEKASNKGFTFGIDPSSEQSVIAGAHRAGIQGTFQGGTRRMPVRDPLRFPRETRPRIKQMLEDYIVDGILPAVEDI